MPIRNELELPWPPSLNRYYRTVGGRMLISKKGRHYREEVAFACIQQQAKRVDGRIKVRIVAHPPDNRTRDLDNLLKGMLDSLQHAGVYENDGQIDLLFIKRLPPVPKGKVFVLVAPMDAEEF
jgi:crossover junction endodeoxyribonuclease RusA